LVISAGSVSASVNRRRSSKVAAGNHAGRAIFLGEVGHRPDCVALDLVAAREREEIERPLVAMNRLGRLAGADRNDLREMELKAGGVAEHFADTAEHHGIHHEVAGFWRARDQPAGPACAASAEIVGTDWCLFSEGTQLCGDLVHDFGADDAIDDDASVVGKRCADLVGGRRRGQMFDHD
jgi:hypothetical protein